MQQPQARAVCTKGKQKLLGFCSNGTLEDLVIIPGNIELFLNPSASLDLTDSWSKECHVLTPSLILKTKQLHGAVSCPHFQSVAFLQQEEESRSSFNYFSFSNLPLPCFILFVSCSRAPRTNQPNPLSSSGSLIRFPIFLISSLNIWFVRFFSPSFIFDARQEEWKAVFQCFIK